MMSFLIEEGIKDALPIIERAAPSIGKLLHGSNSFITTIALPLLKRAFNAGSGDLPSLFRIITSHPDAEVILKSLEEKYGELLVNIPDSLNNVKNFELSLKVEWKDGQNNDT